MSDEKFKWLILRKRGIMYVPVRKSETHRHRHTQKRRTKLSS